MLYEGSQNRWRWWTAGGWTSDPAQGYQYAVIAPAAGPSTVLGYRPAVVKSSGHVHTFYEYDGALMQLVYDPATGGGAPGWSTSQVATISNVLPSWLGGGITFVVGMDAAEKLWIAYVDQTTSLKVLREDGAGGWTGPLAIHESTTDLLPRAMDFVDGTTPVVFFIERDAGTQPTYPRYEGYRVYCISGAASSFWSQETPVVRSPVDSTPEWMDTTRFEWLGQWQHVRTDPPAGAYTPHASASHLELDADRWLYAPRVGLERVNVYDPRYKDEYSTWNPEAPAYVWWADLWALFWFPSAIAVDDAPGREWIFVVNRLCLGGGGTPWDDGRIQRWAREKREVSITSTVEYPLGQQADNRALRIEFGNGDLRWPSDLAVDEGGARLYVTESMKHRVRVYDIHDPDVYPQVQLDSIGSEGSGPGQLLFPQGIDTDEDGNLYVVDSGNHRVQKFSRSGTFLTTWGARGSGPGEFELPFAISVDDVDDVVYVTDPYNRRIQVFDKQGNLQTHFGRWESPWNGEKDFTNVSGIAARGKDLYVSVGNEMVRFVVRPSEIAGEHVFYNNSAWDGEDPAANAADDAAIAEDKVALHPGETATTANYVSFDKGINGIVIDVHGLRGTPAAADFEFRVGNDEVPSGWPAAPAPIAISTRTGAGVDGSDRISLLWADNTIPNSRWLQVRVRSTDTIRIAEDYVFYFGLAIGEGLSPDGSYAVVDAQDEADAHDNPHTPADPAPITDAYDYNRDRLVDGADEAIAAGHGTDYETALRLIAAPTE